MNDFVVRLGKHIQKKAATDPRAAARLLSRIYGLVSFQAAHFPHKKAMPAREYMAAVTAKMMSEAFKKPDMAAVVNIFMPCEIFQALGIPTVFPEAVACYVVNTAAERFFIETAEDWGISESLCSFHKVLLGMAKAKVMPRPFVVANTTLACDANQVSFRKLAFLEDVPHMVIDVPYDTGEDAVAYVAGQLRDMAARLESLSGRRLSQDALKEAIVRGKKSMALYRHYLKKRRDKLLPDSMTAELYSMFAYHALLGTKESLRYTRMLCADVEKLPPIGKTPKIIWMHIMPNWQDSLKGIFDGSIRCQIAACDISMDGFVRMDPERPYESMARRITANRLNGSGRRRIEYCISLAKKLGACGIIIFCQWGCKHTQGLAVMAKRAFEAEGLAALILDGDGCDSANVSDGQMVTRINAFIEQLEGGAHGKRREAWA